MDHHPDETIPSLLIAGAEQTPSRELVRFEDGTTWTWADALREARTAAGELAAFGVGRGDHVAVLLPNGIGWLRAWWGSALRGATIVPMNTAYRGQILSDVCDRSRPVVVVAEKATWSRFADAMASRLVDPADLIGATPLDLSSVEPADPWDVHAVLFTSGTTGRSKGSLTTHTYLTSFAEWITADEGGIGPDDTFLADLPFFHLSGLAFSVQMMRVGGRIAVRSAPTLQRYWDTAKECGATFAIAVGTMAEYLVSLPPSPAERDHSLRIMGSAPLPRDVPGFVERFGLSGLFTTYGATEVNLPVIQSPTAPSRPGSCGKVRDGFEVRVVDEHDRPVPVGTPGELVVRSDRPWVMTQGYLDDPEATLERWRNGWFHTGDLLRVDDDGYFFFHDRSKDALRRRGENISSFEVEREVLAHPAVAEAACVPVSSELGGDDEVKVFVVAKSKAQLDFAEMVRFLVERMPHFMVPRFYEQIDAMPKTATQRVQKFSLRDMGNSSRTWDREAHGLSVTSGGLRSRSRE